MKRFRFRLERLLEIRAHRERQWLAKLAEASGHCLRLSREIDQKSDAARGAFLTEVKRGAELDLALLNYRDRYIERLGKEKRRLKQELDRRVQHREEVQKKYGEVSREKKILEKLKERRQAEYYAGARLEEFKVQDDLNSGQFARKSVQGE